MKIRVEKVAFGGDGLGFVDGKACFVEGALAGETVEAEVYYNKDKFCKARVVAVEEASPERVTPPCPYYGNCGGCQYQHVSYPEELRMKAHQVAEGMTHALKIDPAIIEPIVHSPKFYGYRNSVTLHTTRKNTGAPQRLGFVARDNRTRIQVDNCLLADERLLGVFRAGHALAREEKSRTFRLNLKGEAVSSGSDSVFDILLGDQKILTSSAGFFQNNLDVAARAAARIRAWVEAVRPEAFADLYAGVGTFSILSAAGRVNRIHAIEENGRSVFCLRKNFEDHGLSAENIYKGRTEQVFPELLPKISEPGILYFLNPPRQGIAPKLADLLAFPGPSKGIIYLSCDLAILIRDLKRLIAPGRFKVARVVPFDMFPRSKHIEIAVLLGPC
ncbi:MAG: class I SAM-dependent RNA methyltransferase [Candidatus Omnitrophica bacterium]|nr:class I SAM-dependent RNA methyltransferase [Candidatus Omnitrophota bacterium]